MRRALFLALCLLTSTGAPAAARATEYHWVGAWAASPQAGGDAVSNESFRLFVHTSLGGSQVRLRFSNRYGDAPLTLRNVSVAQPVTPTHPGVDAATVTPVRFTTGDRVTIPVGASVQSLPVRFDVPGNSWLAVSFHAPGRYATSTTHQWAWGLNWHTPPNGGDRASEASGASFISMTDWRYLTGVDVIASSRVFTIVALGDSMTDSTASVPETNTRWPDLLNKRLGAVAGGRRFSVVNAGINGNMVSRNRNNDATFGEAAISRMRWDVFEVPNVSTIVLFLGSNDLTQRVPVGEITRAYERVIDTARQRGIRVVIATLTPHSVRPSDRAAINRWIRRHRHRVDGILGFGELMQNSLAPSTWKQRYNAGDQTHPNALGMKAMADYVPLSVFR